MGAPKELIQKKQERCPSEPGEGNKPPRCRPTLGQFLWALVLLGAILRVATFWSGYCFWDSPYYIQMGRSLAEGGNLELPWGDPFARGDAGYVPQPGHHYAPLFPAVLGAFYGTFGYSLELTRFVSILISISFQAVFYLASRNLLGKARALPLTAIISVDPVLLTVTRDLMPENLVMIFFTLTIWAIVRAIRDDRFMVAAALFAAAGYLTKSSVGYLFIVAGIGGFAWRFYYLRWGVFKRKHYLLAIAIFLGAVAAWSARNLYTFGWPNWGTSPYLDDALVQAIGRPWDLATMLVITFPFFIALLLVYASYWLPWIRRSLGDLRSERTSALWLAVGLVLLITLWFSASLAIYEESDPVLHSAYRIRYLSIAFPPMLWAVAYRLRPFDLGACVGWGAARDFASELVGVLRSLRRRRARASAIAALAVSGMFLAQFHEGYLLAGILLAGGATSLLLCDPRKVLAVMLALFLVLGAEVSTSSVEIPEIELSGDLDRLVGPDDLVAIDGSDINSGYLLVQLHDFDFTLVKYDGPGGGNATFIISYSLDSDYTGYDRVGVYEQSSNPGIPRGAVNVLLGVGPPSATPTVALWQKA